MARSLTARGPPLAIGVVIVALLIASAAYLSSNPSGSVNGPIPRTFTVGSKTFRITYFATNNDQRANGLMNTKITNTTIMLFVFPDSAQHQFWMFDTNSSLDIIWVQANRTEGTVVDVVRSAPPCFVASACQVYTPAQRANYVLEAKGGFANQNGIETGTTIGFS